MASKNSVGLSAEQLERYASAMRRFRDITNALTSGTSTGPMTNGAMAPGAKPAPTSSTGMTRFTDDGFLERLAKLATTPRGPDSAPLTTYTTTSTEHGEVYKASREYVDWLRRKIPGYGVEGSVGQSTPSGTAGREGMTF